MSCIREGVLRAYLDHELPASQVARVSGHLENCARCRKRVQGLQRRAELCHQGLSIISSAQDPDARPALARFYRNPSLRADGQASRLTGRYAMETSNRRRAWRPALAGIAILALLVGIFSFAPSRALARQFLGIFRVRKFAIVQVNPNQAQLQQIQSLQEKLMAGKPEMVVDEPVVQVASAAEASAKAGFSVRLPVDPKAQGTPQISVKGRTEMRAAVSREALMALFEAAGMDANLVPAGLTTADVHITVPATVQARQGQVEIVEVRDPQVDYPEGIDPRLIGQAGLRLLGLSPQEAQRISDHLDWASTLILPIPTNVAEFREVSIGGAEGVLLTSREGAEQGKDVGPHASLLLQKDGILYLLGGNVSPTELQRLAETMF
jgi:hypothetical protein